MPESPSLVGPLDRALYLRTLPGFADLRAADLAVVARSVRERSFAAGEHLLEPGEPVRSLFLLVHGSVHVSTPAHPNRLLQAGEPVGLLSFLARAESGIEAVAAEDSLSLELDADALSDLYEDHFTLLHNQLKTLASGALEQRMRVAPGTLLAPWPVPIEDTGQPLDLVERLVLLRRAGGPFQRASLTALSELARQIEDVRFAAGDLIWRRGDPSGYLLLITSGTVRCTLADGSTFRCGAGYPMGNLESMSERPRWYQAVAETALITQCSRNAALLDVLEDHFDMAMDLIAAMASNLLNALRTETPTP